MSFLLKLLAFPIYCKSHLTEQFIKMNHLIKFPCIVKRNQINELFHNSVIKIITDEFVCIFSNN